MSGTETAMTELLRMLLEDQQKRDEEAAMREKEREEEHRRRDEEAATKDREREEECRKRDEEAATRDRRSVGDEMRKRQGENSNGSKSELKSKNDVREERWEVKLAPELLERHN